MQEVKNINSEIPDNLTSELTEMLAGSGKVRIERILSNGHSSPEDFWYDQEENEWVMLLKGRAELLFEKDMKIILLNPGDHINIPAHEKHKVKWTVPGEVTIWLAVFYPGK